MTSPDATSGIVDRNHRLAELLVGNRQVLAVLLEVNGFVVDANPTLPLETGMPLERLRHMSFASHLHSQSQSTFQEQFEKSLNGTSKSGFDVRVGKRWFSVSLATMRGQDGEVIGVSVTGWDISEQRESEANFRTFFECISELTTVATREGKILVANKALRESLGYTEDELSTKHLTDLHPRNQREEVLKTFAAILRGELNVCRIPLLKKDGHIVPTECRITLGHWNGGECIFVVSKDLTGEQEAEERYRRLFEVEPDAIILVELETGRFIDANPAALRLYGYSRDEFLHMKVPDVSAEPQKSTQAISAQRSFVTLRWHRKKDGTIFPVEIAGDYFWLQGRKVHVAAIRDTTERRKLEDRLRQSQKMEALGHLTGGMAHEFNNILAAIMMNLSLIKVAQSEVERVDMISEMELSSQRAADLVKQLLAFSRKSVMQVESLNLRAVCMRQTHFLKSMLGERIEVRCTSEEVLPLVRADKVMMEQVLLNLCLNARDSMKEGGVLSLELTSKFMDKVHSGPAEDILPGKYVCLSVTDTGCGMNSQTIEHLFEPFFTTKEVGKGTGLGLATVRGMIQQHHGWVEVESQLGKGSTFRVFLPALEDEPLQECGEPVKDVPTLDQGVLLVVEDDVTIRKLTRTLLAQIGFRVLDAGNGEEAMTLWHKHAAEIDVVYSDMIMPGEINGLQLAERILAERPDVRVIITSGYTQDWHDSKNPPSLPILFLPKPCAPKIFIGAIQKCLAAKRQSQ